MMKGHSNIGGGEVTRRLRDEPSVVVCVCVMFPMLPMYRQRKKHFMEETGMRTEDYSAETMKAPRQWKKYSAVIPPQ